MMKRFFLAALLLLTVLAGGCADESEDYGVVARVNGRPIYLEELDFRHDISHEETVGGYVPTVEQLRNEYGTILGDLIIQELVMEELERRGLEVTDEELKRAEQTILADYPDRETFEQVLVEEYVDIDDWRRELAAREVMEKFQQQVLRPQIKIDYKEAEEYYHDNIGEFYLPRRYRILVVRGEGKDAVEHVAKTYLGDKADGKDVKTDGVDVRESVVRADRVPTTWTEELEKGNPGDALSVTSDGAGFERIVLLEKYPPKVLDPTQAYPLVEEVLLEQKLGAAFDKWLSGALATADIRITEHLLEKKTGESGQLPSASSEEPVESDNSGVTEEDLENGEDGLGPDVMPEGVEDAEEAAGDAPVASGEQSE